MKKILLKILLILIFIFFVYIVYHFSLDEYWTLDYVKKNQNLFQSFYQNRPWLTLSIFLLVYVSLTAFSIPGATVLTLIAGATLGLPMGIIFVSIASTLGATFSFLFSRFLFRDYVEKKFHKYFKIINEGIDQNEGSYLLSLRLIPIFPFFVVNLVMGITNISVLKYFFISQIGMLPATIVYINAGLQLGSIQDLNEILSFKILASFALLGILPFFFKSIFKMIFIRKIYKEYKKPKKFDYNLIIIGGGAAGLVTAYISATLKAKVALIEKNKMGGDCLNTGCVPSKALIKSAKLIYQMKNAHKYGLKDVIPMFDFQEIMERIRNIISMIEPHDSIKRYQQLGVDCFQGSAKILSPWEVEINGKILTTKNITIATGATPIIPSIDGLEKIQPLTSENIWNLKYLPQKMIIIGGGPIGCEMAQSFSRLGSEVIQIEISERILKKEDPEVAKLIEKKLKNEGVKILTNHRILEIQVLDGKKNLYLEHDGKRINFEFDEILLAIGRKANFKGLGVEKLGIKIRNDNTLNANEYLETNFPNIFVCGDVTGPYQLTHMASHQAWYCSINSLFGKLKKFKVDYSVVPWSTYCDPEIATVGLNEQLAKKSGIEYELTSYEIKDLDRAIVDSESFGILRVLTAPKSDKILGVTIVANHASDLILEFIMAMKSNIGLNKILETIHIYPTMGEANKYVAGNWKKKQYSNTIFQWLAIFHKWNRN